MRVIPIALALLLVLLQIPLWFGKGGWLDAADMARRVEITNKRNQQLAERNEKLRGEVGDLREGTKVAEERARLELGMIGDGEIYIHVTRK